MKKVFLTWMAILAAIITVNAQVNVWDGSHEAWTNGSGTKDDPYLIESAAHLAHLAYLVKRDMIFVNTGWTTDEKNHTFGTGIYYKLTTDIDLNGLEWIPIGCRQNTAQYWTYYVCHFGGHFDGNGHTVANLSIRTSDIESSGLFGHVRGATVQNLGITGNDSIIAGNAGAIAGYCAGNTTITNCYNTIYISTGGASGGIVGINNGVLTIINCYNKGMVNNGYAGGIIGETRNMSELNIVNCYNTAPITTKRGASGGIIGNVYRIANVVNCYNTGTVVNAIGGGTNVNCYVLAGCAKNRPSEVQELTETVMKSPEFGRMLKYYFVQDVEPYQNEGYPVHSHLLLETLEVSDITETSVTLNAMFDPGNNPVPAIQKGFQYKTFRVDDSLWINLVVNTDAFSYNLTGLASGKAYHFKPFIVMEPGDTIYGAERSFATIHNGSRAIWDGSAMPVTPDGDTYYIYYPDELAWIAQQCNSGYNFAGKNVMLMNDLDLNGNETLQWTPIGHSARFAGNFEGNNHTVHNLYITNGENLLGLFGSTNGATIRNLSLANGVIISTSAHTGAIVGWVLDTTTITNCHNALYISTGGASGGIVGKCDGVITIINCYNKGKINGTVAGGIIGEITGMNTSNISNCYNIATIVASSGTAANKIGGGIVGTSAINVNVINCYNTGTADNAIIASGGGKYTNCYILESSAKYIPFEVLALTETVMKSSEFVEMLGYAFVQDTEPYQNAGYPVHSGFL
ncbi:MAG: fibronectin type III domain-containing protein, partial [Tannerella sp.]|nr:fibronectin type III domain-containing protein [Tannerella sp.]